MQEECDGLMSDVNETMDGTQLNQMNCTQPIVRVYRCDIGNALLTIVCAKHG